MMGGGGYSIPQFPKNAPIISQSHAHYPQIKSHENW